VVAAGAHAPRDALVLGAGVATALKRQLHFYADLNAELNHAQRSYGLTAGLRYRW
jgi:outer membrane autotransporter protein